MCRVTLGKPVEQYNAIKIAHAPPGHHSVIGRPSTGGLHYPEYAIYRGEQVRGRGTLYINCRALSSVSLIFNTYEKRRDVGIQHQ